MRDVERCGQITEPSLLNAAAVLVVFRNHSEVKCLTSALFCTCEVLDNCFYMTELES